MTIALSEVKAVCTASELELVRDSRKPRLEKLTLAEATKSARLARKQFDKWQDLDRSQARTRSRRAGVGEVDNRTTKKVEIFQEALQRFEARVAHLERKGKSAPSQAASGTPKKVRSAKHRATRAAVRGQLAEKESMLNAKRATKRKASAVAKPMPTSAAPSGTAKAAASSANAAPTVSLVVGPDAPTVPVAPAKPKKRLGKPVVVGRAQPLLSPAREVTANAAAKKSRIVRSGLTTRMRGHVSARGRRAQGKRDARNA